MRRTVVTPVSLDELQEEDAVNPAALLQKTRRDQNSNATEELNGSGAFYQNLMYEHRPPQGFVLIMDLS